MSDLKLDARPYGDGSSVEGCVNIVSDDIKTILVSDVEERFAKEICSRWNTRAAPTVKALNWTDIDNRFVAYVQLPLSTLKYVIEQNGVEAGVSKSWFMELNLFDTSEQLVNFCSFGKDYSSPAEAKAAAQSHYEKLVLEALE